MSQEFYLGYPSGHTIYAMIRALGGNVWDVTNGEFTTYATANVDDYDMQLTDKSGNYYEGDCDTDLPKGRYTVQLFLQSGAAPVDPADTWLASEDFQWNGTERVSAGLTVTPAGSVSISKSDVLDFVNEKLHRSETDIDDEIQRVLDNLADANLLVGSDTGTITSNYDTTIDLPTNFKQMISLRLNDGSNDGAPLIRIPGGIRGYRERQADGLDYGEPEYYAEFNGKCYLDPACDGAYTPYFEFYSYHPPLSGDTGNILFGGEFDRAIKYGVTFEVASTKRMSAQMAVYGPLFEREKAIRMGNMNYEPHVVGGVY